MFETYRSNKENQQLNNLNLYNFETKEAFNSPYILTSPRSLKSCRLANIEPIELLHRSLQDISTDANVSLQKACQMYTDYENERLRKLEVCKLIRKHMLAIDIGEDESFEQYFEKPTHYSRGSTPEFPQFLKQRQLFSPALTTSPTIQFVNSPVKKQKNKSFHENFSSSETSSPLELCQSEKKRRLRRTRSAESKHGKISSQVCVTKPNSPIIKNESKKYESILKNTNSHTAEKRPNDRHLCWQVDQMKKSRSSSTNPITHPENSNQCLNRTHSRCQSPKRLRKSSHVKIEIQKKTISKKKLSKQDDSKSKKKDSKNHNSNVKIQSKLFETVGNQSFSDPLEGIKNHDIRILDAMFFNREKEQLERNFARKADLVWDACGCKNFLIEKNGLSKIDEYVKPDVCTCNENRMFNTYFQQIRNKMKQLKENSLNKELHSEQVRQLARELQTGMEQWQDQVLLLQWRALQKAKINAKLQLESKRLKTQTENNERALLHALRFRNVQETERRKQQIVKKEIQEKDYRIEKLKIKREREIMDCKAQAQYTAELRDQLRRTLTPETFDRKVNDALVKSKFITRSLTSSPFVQSHIRLG